MKHIATLFLSAAEFAAFAADVQRAALNDLDLDANPQVVTNVTFAGLATTNAVAAAIAALPAPDYSPTNAALRATIEAVAPAPGDYENISNRVMRAISLPGDEGHPGGLFKPRFVGRADLAVGAGSVTKPSQSPDPGELTLKGREQEDAEGAVSGVWWPSFKDAWNTWHWVASEDYVDSAIAAIPESVSPETVTNIVDDALAHFDPPIATFDVYAEDVTNVVRGCSLGGIWDNELEVWWTPVMVGGSLTYQATTNVNLNAEN